MTLEPLNVSAEGGGSPELRDMTRRFWIGTALTVPVVILEMAGHLPVLNLRDYVPARVAIGIQFVLATPVVLWALHRDEYQVVTNSPEEQ
jgi:Cu+-exporting ATPase